MKWIFTVYLRSTHIHTLGRSVPEPRRESDLPFRISAIDAKDDVSHLSKYIYYLCVNSDEIIGVPVAGLNNPCNQLCPPLEKVRVSPHPFLSFFFIFFLFYFFFFKSSFSIDKCRIDVNMRRMSLRSLPYKESICTRNNNILLYGHTNMRAKKRKSV